MRKGTCERALLMMWQQLPENLPSLNGNDLSMEVHTLQSSQWGAREPLDTFGRKAIISLSIDHICVVINAEMMFLANDDHWL